MRNFWSKMAAFSFAAMLISSFALAQGTSVSGKITDSTGEPLAGVNIVVKGQVIGTISDIDGNYNLSIKTPPPITLVISMVGFTTQEIDITTESNAGLDIVLEEQLIMGQEIVVSASRTEESIMDSPVTIEKIGILSVKNAASDSYYKSISNLKGVDMSTSSINFQIFNARGFNSTTNTRFVQLIDGMDTQAPALNFPIGSLNGPSNIDVESVEFMPGASSALYGPNAFNGILLINSKNAFDYQGLSANVKFSMNHIGDSDLNSEEPIMNPQGNEWGPGNAQPMYEANIRYAKAFNNKFAFKVNFSYSQATDWYGTSMQDRNAASKPSGFNHNPGADRLHAFGDEVALNLGLLRAVPEFVGAAQALGLDINLLDPITVSRTPYLEQDLVDYNASNLKVGGGLYYRITDKMELSYNYSYGGGTTVYTGAQRYSLADFSIQSHKIELRGDNFYVRGYTTQENSGGSYIADLTGVLINNQWEENGNWFAKYGLGYLQNITLNPTNREGAHRVARDLADLQRWQPGSEQFNQAKNAISEGVIPNGSKFADKSAMYHAEGQFNFKNEIDWLDLIVGASYKLYDLRSNGTVFPDTPDNPITISEYGAYAQASKALLNDDLRITASVRFDKNENFNGQVNPRVSAVVKPAKDHSIRVSYQTGFRNPTTQGQHIDLNVVSARLIGGLKYYRDQYNIFDNAYTMSSVNQMIEALATSGNPLLLGSPDILGLLERVTEADVPQVKPEQITSFEAGYRGLIDNRVMIDVVGYFNIYNNFITQVQVRKAAGLISLDGVDATNWPFHPNTEQNIRNAQTLLTPITTPGQENTFQTYTNFDRTVQGAGAALSIDYMIGRGYTVGANYNWNRLVEGLDANFLNDFNTPEHKINASFSNRKVTDNFGFNIVYRWQTDFRWESTFGSGTVPAIGTLDAQVSYKLKAARTVLKLGGSNLLNTKHVLNYGGPTLGAIYYISLTFDELLN